MIMRDLAYKITLVLALRSYHVATILHSGFGLVATRLSIVFVVVLLSFALSLALGTFNDLATTIFDEIMKIGG